MICAILRVYLFVMYNGLILKVLSNITILHHNRKWFYITMLYGSVYNDEMLDVLYVLM